MAIKEINFSVPEGLAKEMKTLSSLGVSHALSFYKDPKQYYQEYLDKADGQELIRRIYSYGKNLKILDIGVGMGQSSFYLSDIGHKVTVVEPSLECCQIIDGLSIKFRSNINVFQCSGEDMHKIDYSDFDLCIFNSSLHHCYDPGAALKNCYDLLKTSGQLLVINELFLKPYQSKERFYRKLESNPVSMGNYGGNEHAYYHGEYKEMLNCAGFLEITEHIPFSYEDIRSIIKQKMSAMINGQYMYSDISLLYRYIWYLLAKRLVRIKLIANLLTKLSFINSSFEAIKNEN